MYQRETQLKTPTGGTREGTMVTQSKGRYIVRYETDRARCGIEGEGDGKRRIRDGTWIPAS